MRYAQGGGPSGEHGQFREGIRMEAAERFALGESSSAMAKESRVSVRSVQRWRRTWSRGGRGPCVRPARPRLHG
ncbi:helix-turn-helix domain-containing protein [Streptomyces sp. NPDC002698]|uniref:helix-turn-helix domain-containing protein n=1 Tax=Streptomyces sp. NPDC002698 TaxID=3364660 RepID=UPI0036882D34